MDKSTGNRGSLLLGHLIYQQPVQYVNLFIQVKKIVNLFVLRAKMLAFRYNARLHSPSVSMNGEFLAETWHHSEYVPSATRTE